MRNPPVFGARVVGRDAVSVSHGNLSVLYVDAQPVAYRDQITDTLVIPLDVTSAERRTINKWARERGYGNTRGATQRSRGDVEEVAKSGHSVGENPCPRGRGRRRRGRRENPRGRRASHSGYLYTEGDVGGYIDGALGEDHAVQRMRQLLSEIAGAFPVSPVGGAARELLQEQEEELKEEHQGEWLDDATENVLMHENVTAPGLVWMWEAGDLGLTTEEEAE